MTAYLIAFLVWLSKRNSKFVFGQCLSGVLPCLIRDKCADPPFVQCISCL